MLSRFEAVIQALPDRERFDRGELLGDALRLHADDRVEVYYAPFDWSSPSARVVVVGLTPGFQQMEIAVRTARRALVCGAPAVAAGRRAKLAARLAGPMRTTLTSMLDRLGVNHGLGLASTAALFEEHAGQSPGTDVDAGPKAARCAERRCGNHPQPKAVRRETRSDRPLTASGLDIVTTAGGTPIVELLHTTSALRYPVFTNGKNYSGHGPRATSHEYLLRMAESFLAPDLAAREGVLVVPLGRAVQGILDHVAGAELDRRTFVLRGFPHPSGANGHRFRHFEEGEAAMRRSVRAWRASGAGAGR